MSGKEKHENFDDDFDLDTIDEEESWPSENESFSDTTQGDQGESSLASEAEAEDSAEKKKGGSALGKILGALIVLGLGAGGSIYAYQTGLLPAESVPKQIRDLLPPPSPSVSAQQDNQTPPVALASENDTGALSAENQSTSDPDTSEIPVDATPSDPALLSSGDMPPMPDANAQASAQEGSEISGQDSAVVSDSQDEVLTPMPGASEAKQSDLPPLVESQDGSIEISEVAEKDGGVDPVVQSADGEIQTDVTVTQGISENISNQELPSTDTSAVTSAVTPSSEIDQAKDSLASQEDALLEQTEKTVTEAPQANETVAVLPEATTEEKPEPVTNSQATDLSVPEAQTDMLAAPKEAAAENLPEAIAEETATVSGDAPTVEQNKAQASISPVTKEGTEKPSEESVASNNDTSIETPTSPSIPVETQVKETVQEKQQIATLESSAVEKKQVKPVTKPAPKWKLRSAQPGAAVIYDPQSGEMKNIEVGSKVAGIGKVKSISQVNGKWVVKGSAGKISQ